jgi:hypothetical protein
MDADTVSKTPTPLTHALPCPTRKKGKTGNAYTHAERKMT